MDCKMTSLHVLLGLKYSYPVRRLSSSLIDEKQEFLNVVLLMCSFFYSLVFVHVDKLKFTMKRELEEEKGRT